MSIDYTVEEWRVKGKQAGGRYMGARAKLALQSVKRGNYLCLCVVLVDDGTSECKKRK